MQRERQEGRPGLTGWRLAIAAVITLLLGAAALAWWAGSGGEDPVAGAPAGQDATRAPGADPPKEAAGQEEAGLEAEGELTPDPSTAEGIRQILGEVWEEDQAKPRFEGRIGPFEVGSDQSRFSIEAYYPCEYEPGTAFEFSDRTSELNFETQSAGLVHAVCSDGTVTYVEGAEGARWYFRESPPYVFSEAPADRLELTTIGGMPALLERSAYADVPYGDFGDWFLWILQREPGDAAPGILVRTTEQSYDALIANAEAILGTAKPSTGAMSRRPSPYGTLEVRNPFRGALGWYPRHDLWYYPHKWDWSAIPSSLPPGVC